MNIDVSKPDKLKKDATLDEVVKAAEALVVAMRRSLTEVEAHLERLRKLKEG